MGAYSTLADNVEVYNLGPIDIGDHTVISQNVHLCNGTHDYKDPSLPLLRPNMTIGSGVWVCADAFVGPGVTIGDNSLVGARAVVTKDVPAGVIVGGNPARVLKPRPLGGMPSCRRDSEEAETVSEHARATPAS
ncbi:MAG: putative colanic acid biosynthesis acetyltransferase [Phycisphaeraceae bacterium]|nr:putative colanic acid biosynthesis acetyltransferase [Phycisphaeraceae bacterium]MCW5754885.1 putative colanic acid biosynthesis acetyltransferase [Phycisphaeraceae bacterium]